MKKIILSLFLCIGFFCSCCYASTGSFSILKTPDNNMIKNVKCCAIGNNSVFIIDKNYNETKYSILNIDNNSYSNNGVIENCSNINFIPLKNGNIFMLCTNYKKDNSEKTKTYAAIYNPKTNTLDKLAETEGEYHSVYMLELENGNIFINKSTRKRTQVAEFDINKNTFINHPDLKETRYGHKGLEISPNKILLAGGEGKNVEIYDINTNTSEIVDVDLRTVSWGNNTKLFPVGDKKYLLFVQKVYSEDNGQRYEVERIIDPENPKSGYEKYYHDYFLGILDLKNKSIEEIIPDSKFKLRGYDAELLPDDKILIIGGAYGSLKNGIVTLDTARIYDIKTQKITILPNKMHYNREGMRTLKINPNIYLIYDGVSETSLFPRPEIFQYK